MAALDDLLVNETSPLLDPLLDELLYARHVEVQSAADLLQQRGTPIPALFNTFYKFVQNPSSVSVDTFKRMIDTDDTVGSGVDFLTTCLAARMGRYTHPSPEIAEWVNQALNRLEGGFMNAVKELLSASWAGFAVQEQVWANDPELGFIVKKLVSMPPQTLLFETERTGELTPDGILQYQRNYNPSFAAGGVSYLFGFASTATAQGGFRPDPYAKLGDLPYPLRTANTYSYMAIRIPKSKCIHYSFDAQGKFGNPYGRSLLRRCYKYYVMKDAFLSMMSVALDRKGTPLTIVYADGQQTLRDPTKVGDTQYAGSNRSAGIRADVAARNAFRNIHNDSVIILPGKKGQVFEHEVVQQSSNAGDFLEALKFCNQGIMRALLIPSLIFTNGDGSGSYALGQEHAKTFDKILDGWLAGFTQVLLDQFISRMLKLNFPRTAWEKDGFGEFGKRELSQDEVEKELKSIETAVNIGAIDMNDLEDLNQVRDKIGFAERDTIIEKQTMGFDEFGNPIESEPGAERVATVEEGAAPSPGAEPGSPSEDEGQKPKPPGTPAAGDAGVKPQQKSPAPESDTQKRRRVRA